MSEGVTPSRKGAQWSFSLNTHNLIGGLTVAVVALVLLGYGFYIPNTTIPRIMSALIALIGVGCATSSSWNASRNRTSSECT